LTNKALLQVHFLDSKRQPTAETIRSNAAIALAAIREFRPNVLIASDDDAVKYVVEPHFKHGPIPVVFCGVNWSCAQYGLPTPHVTGMIEVVPIADAIRTMQGHYPGVKKLAVLSEDSTSERSNRELLDPLYRRLGLEPTYALVTDFTAWKTAFVKANAEADLIYLPTNGAIKDWDTEAAAAWVREHIRKPVITCDDFMMPYCVLGITKVAREQGEWAARATLDILGGKAPPAIPLATNAQKRIYLNANLANHIRFQPGAALQERCIPFAAPNPTNRAPNRRRANSHFKGDDNTAPDGAVALCQSRGAAPRGLAWTKPSRENP
jgi:ABC-type uncharacterized transport system substrate-binding protein